MMEVISREEAKAKGLMRYFTGNPCKHGHISERYVTGGKCVVCKKTYTKGYDKRRYEQNKDIIRAKYNKYANENREKVREINKKSRQKNIEKERHRDLMYRIKNKDNIRRRMSEYEQKNKEKIKERKKDYYKNNKHVFDAAVRRRRALKNNSFGSFSHQDVIKIMEDQKGKCAYCRKRLRNGYHVDHIMPLSKGGNNIRSNIQITCAKCNLSKGAKLPEDFARETGRLI